MGGVVRGFHSVLEVIPQGAYLAVGEELGQRVAMRGGKWMKPDTHGLIYLLGDHLGSASLAVDPIIDSFDSLPNVLTELRYTPWGKTRQAVGEMATDYRSLAGHFPIDGRIKKSKAVRFLWHW